MSSINVSDGSNLTFNSSIRGQEAFNISKDLTINATGSFLNLGNTRIPLMVMALTTTPLNQLTIYPS